VRTSWGSVTDRGRVRTLNEDSVLTCPPVFVVADGMGGHHAGEVASRLVVEELAGLAGRSDLTPQDVDACLDRAVQRLRTVVDHGATAGTTVAGVIATTHDGAFCWLVLNIGDSRVYRYSAGTLEQVSVDHSLVQELVERGVIDAAEARRHPDRHVITRAVGTGDTAAPDYWFLPAVPGDRMLVCSDGLTAELPDPTLADLLRVDDPQSAAERLVAEALAAGGADNITAVVVDLVPEPADGMDGVDGDTVPRPTGGRGRADRP
jgi:PPM family protein phosphatase